VPSSRVFAITDPVDYRDAIRGSEAEIYPTARGNFRAEIIRIDLHQLWMQRVEEGLPALVQAAEAAERPTIFFLAETNHRETQFNGVQFLPGEIAFSPPNGFDNNRSFGPTTWGAMSLSLEDFAAAGRTLCGRELTIPSTTLQLRPPPELMTRLKTLHERAARLAETTPGRLVHPEVARSLEQALAHAMIRCLDEASPVRTSTGRCRHVGIIGRLKDFIVANPDQPLHLADICAATGASERTLRICCHEQLGMGPLRYLWLRRMHLARRALIRAQPTTATVTGVATEYGFWELGRFSVQYRALFGESPSASLRRPPQSLKSSY
jgi:AraC-like DNA-binding protein